MTGSPTGTLKNNNWNDDAFASKVLFNFVDTEAGDTITIASNGQFQGSILAPEADINSIGNVIEGLVIANDVYTGGQELHLPTLDTVFAQKLIAAVPEPSAYALIFGFTSMLFLAAKRRAR